MSVYPRPVLERLREPHCGDDGADANCAGNSASFECGSFLRFRMLINSDTKCIESVIFKTNGCGFAIAAAEVLAEIGERRALTDGFGTEFLVAAIEANLGAFEEPRRQCATLAINAFRAALEDFRGRSLDEFSGEKALVCTCFGVSEEAIELFIASNRGATTDDVGAATNAGTGCGSCRFLIAEMLDFRDDAP